MTARDPFADEPVIFTNAHGIKMIQFDGQDPMPLEDPADQDCESINPLGFMSINPDWEDPKADYDPEDQVPFEFQSRKPLSPKQQRLREAAKSLRTTYQWGNEDGDDPVLPVVALSIVRLTLAVEDLTAEVKALREQRKP
ncbi:MAG: hypothetical protein RI949_260 [Pseudomonadota bacterium]